MNRADLRHSTLLLILATVITGCTHPPQPDPAPRPVPEPSSTTAAGTQAATNEICSRFTIAALSIDTTIDRGPADPRRRAADQYGTPDLADTFAREGRDPQWPQLTQHHARVLVTTTPAGDDPPPHQPTQAATAVHAHRTAIGHNGWHQPLTDLIVYCTLTRHTNRWTITAVTITDTTTAVTP